MELDPVAVMAEHAEHGPGSLVECSWEEWADKGGPDEHCLPYRLAEALAASEAKVARVLDLGRYWNGPGHGPGRWDSSHAIEIRAAIDGTLDWSRWEKDAVRWAQERGLSEL